MDTIHRIGNWLGRLTEATAQHVQKEKDVKKEPLCPSMHVRASALGHWVQKTGEYKVEQNTGAYSKVHV